MTTIAVRFLTGVFHATPWGHHVNEGVPEWPPSPWRLFRALIAAWKRARADIPEEKVAGLIRKLSSHPPDFRLPPATLAHKRHYMPLGEEKSLVLDTFVVMSREDPVLVIWNCDLSADERELLENLLKEISYFGRSESWCEMRLVDGGEPNCFVVSPDRTLSDEYEFVRVLSPREDVTLADLMVDTNDLRLHRRRLDPPGGRWVLYAVPINPFAIKPGGLGSGGIAERAPVVARYLLDSNPLPLVFDTVRIAELARRAAMSRYGSLFTKEARSPILSGKDLDGKPLKGHRHAFYLPTDEDRDGRLDHLTIYASGGFPPGEQSALVRLSTLNLGKERTEIRLLFLGFSHLPDRGEQHTLGCLFDEDTCWQSATPLMLTRHPKTYHNGLPKITPDGYQRDGPEDQIIREWRLRQAQEGGLPDIESIERVDHLEVRGRRLSWLDFKRWRTSGSAPAPTAYGGGFRITFREPVRGPITFGYANHYGLGLFLPASSRAGGN